MKRQSDGSTTTGPAATASRLGTTSTRSHPHPPASRASTAFRCYSRECFSRAGVGGEQIGAGRRARGGDGRRSERGVLLVGGRSGSRRRDRRTQRRGRRIAGQLGLPRAHRDRRRVSWSTYRRNFCDAAPLQLAISAARRPTQSGRTRLTSNLAERRLGDQRGDEDPGSRTALATLSLRMAWSSAFGGLQSLVLGRDATRPRCRRDRRAESRRGSSSPASRVCRCERLDLDCAEDIFVQVTWCGFGHKCIVAS